MTRKFKRVFGSALTLSYGVIAGREPGGTVVVSKKVAKSAVVRNRLKRILRPALSAALRGNDTPSLIVTVRKNVPPDDLRAEFEKLLFTVPRF